MVRRRAACAVRQLELEQGLPRSVPSCTARGGGGPNFGGNVGWGRVTIPMPPLKKLVAYKKMGDTVGGS